jgi:hypothetical protein
MVDHEFLGFVFVSSISDAANMAESIIITIKPNSSKGEPLTIYVSDR